MEDSARQRGRRASGGGSTGKGKDGMKLGHVQGEDMGRMMSGMCRR